MRLVGLEFVRFSRSVLRGFIFFFYVYSEVFFETVVLVLVSVMLVDLVVTVGFASI